MMHPFNVLSSLAMSSHLTNPLLSVVSNATVFELMKTVDGKLSRKVLLLKLDMLVPVLAFCPQEARMNEKNIVEITFSIMVGNVQVLPKAGIWHS